MTESEFGLRGTLRSLQCGSPEEMLVLCLVQGSDHQTSVHPKSQQSSFQANLRWLCHLQEEQQLVQHIANGACQQVALILKLLTKLNRVRQKRRRTQLALPGQPHHQPANQYDAAEDARVS